ncbi:MAG: hypothetical protein ACR2Q4_17500 [Geminicoccaceae bacterium]
MSAQSDIMPDRQEVLASLYGAFRLAIFDERGLNYFNLSIEGFWRSFAALFLMIPIYGLLMIQGLLPTGDGLSIWAVLVGVLSEGVGWAIFALVTLVATDLLKLGHRYTPLIVAVNWSAVIASSALLLVWSIALMLPEGPAQLIVFVITVGVIVYQWFVMRTALQTTSGIALAFVLFSILLSVMLQRITDRIF